MRVNQSTSGLKDHVYVLKSGKEVFYVAFEVTARSKCALGVIYGSVTSTR